MATMLRIIVTAPGRHPADISSPPLADHKRYAKESRRRSSAYGMKNNDPASVGRWFLNRGCIKGLSRHMLAALRLRYSTVLLTHSRNFALPVSIRASE